MKKIAVLGGGQVGSSLAKILTDDGNDITLVDINSSVLEDLQEDNDIKTIHGNGSSPSTLKQAELNDCDILIATTGSDEVNLVSCHLAKKMFNVPTVIARLRNSEFQISTSGFDLDLFSIDSIISPSKLVTDFIKNIIEHPGAFQAFDFADGKLQVIGATVLKDGPLAGKKLSEFKNHLPNVDVKVVALYRNRKTIPVNGSTIIEIGDDIFFLATPENMRFISELSKNQSRIENIMIAGGGNVGMTLATALSKKFSTKIIEKNLLRSKYLSESLEDTVVLNDDISDESLLENEGIEDVDFFCSVTNDDQMNILSAKLAKDLGANKSISIINKLSYRKLVSKEIDVVVSPEDVTIGSILASVRTSDVVKVHSLGFGEAEILEIIIHGDKNTSKVVDRKVSDFELPTGCKIGAIYRDGDIILMHNNLTIKSNDRLIIYLLHKKDFSKLAKLFQVGIGFF
ncbi:MAG: Trk system potassium transporter TrkA [Gammaproteobacteria bacterium]|nr:Trk system potassium transporter TrkA [Gammaproteobacteria bacterium]MBL6819296.1 Trk system potassium transporter TrkA [Gammaproteobacteria bacterium]MBL6898475.1 Trk system potassium transporter TrkA [Gammaproteobacteria bacterium]